MTATQVVAVIKRLIRAEVRAALGELEPTHNLLRGVPASAREFFEALRPVIRGAVRGVRIRDL